MNALSLYELNHLVRLTLEHSLSHDYWVEAELSEVRQSRGHCYMELVQKDERGATPIARASAKCWQQTWAMLQPYFERTTGQQLHAGMKVRLKVRAQFHEAYGFSWIVSDIDPTFTLGDMARRRQEIIRQLKEEGVFDMQRELSLPLFCQRIAVVSSASAAGYGDFVRQLADNAAGVQFHAELFPATMQGGQVEQSVIAALNAIYERAASFDCVVIIRGGGATADMSGFDTLALAENVAQFPLPIITGIGHDRDESVLDMVSFQRVKTPTAAAQLLIDHLSAVLTALDDAQDAIAHYARQKITLHQTQLEALAAAIPRLFSVVRTRQEARIDMLASRLLAQMQQKMAGARSRLDAFEERLPMMAQRRLTSEQHRLEMLTEKTRALDPRLLLRRGYSITLKDGRAVRSPKELSAGDIIETHVAEGIIKSATI